MIERNHTQVIVVGGGVIGASILYALAKRGIHALLLERDSLAAGTAGATDGYITYHTKRPGIHLQMGMMSGGMFGPLAEEIQELAGVDIHYEANCGSMQVLDREEEWPFLEELARRQRADAGLEVDMYPIEELRRMEPALDPTLIGGLYSPTAGKVDPIRLAVGLAGAAKRLGARIAEGCRVTGILAEGGAVRGVRTSRGDYCADVVVDAAGTWGGQVAAMAGVSVPIRPRRGQLLVTEPLPPLVHATMQCGRTTAVKLDPRMLELLDPKAAEMGMGFCLEQTREGTVLIGFTREFVGYDRRTTLDAIERIARRAYRYIPVLGRAHIIRTFAGLRPYTPDGLPILGAPEGGPKGLVLAAGHEGDGICLAPLTGRLIAELIAGETPSFPLEPFRCGRFWDQDSGGCGGVG